MPTPAPQPPPHKIRSGWYIAAAGLFAVLVVLLVEGLARTVWLGIGGMIRFVWLVGRALWRLVAPG